MSNRIQCGLAYYIPTAVVIGYGLLVVAGMCSILSSVLAVSQ